jgi:hypothetical protein
MHINITKSETGNNKGSCGNLVTYLEKENRLAEKLDRHFTPEYWFNHRGETFQPYEVRQAIDQNVGRLSRDDAKFFLINISPSEREIEFLKDCYGDDIKAALKAYGNNVMDAYAKNFKRSGVESNNNLVYFGKLEQHRYYTYKDLEVRQGKAKREEPKPGEQLHLQIIVSRKDASDSIKLSPLNNSRGGNEAHSQKVGQFDRVAFKQLGEDLFDRTFSYGRQIKESFKYANTLKHGTSKERAELRELAQSKQEKGIVKDYSKGPSLMETLLKTQGQNYGAPVVDENWKWRKKKKRHLDHGLEL